MENYLLTKKGNSSNVVISLYKFESLTVRKKSWLITALNYLEEI